MTAQELKNSILQLAIQGKLVKQDPNDEPASVLLEKIKEEREKLIKEKKIKREKYSEIYKDPLDNHYYEKFEDGTVNDITEEIPFDIPNNWVWTKFKNICNIVSARRVHQSDWKKTGIPFYRAREIGKLADNGFVNNELFISEELYEEFSKSGVPKQNDIMITAVGTLGKCYIVKSNDKFYYKDASVICLENIFNINPKYLVNFINSDTMIKQIKSNSSGTTVETLTMVRMNEYYLPIPPIEEQKRIVDKLASFYPLIHNYENKYCKIENLNTNYKDELKKSILQYAIQGKLVKQDPSDESAEVLINRILDEKRKLIKTKQIKKENLSVIYKDSTDNQFYEKFEDGKIVNITNEIPFDIPNNWCWTRLKNISSIISKGTTPKGGKNSYLSNGINFLRAENVKSTGLISLNNVMYISKETHNNYLKRSILEDNDILICIAGTLGRCAIIKKEQLPANTNQAVAFVRYINKDVFFVKFSQLAISSFDVQRMLIKQTKVTAIPNLTLEIISNCLLPVPPVNEQIKIVNKIENIFNYIKTAE